MESLAAALVDVQSQHFVQRRPLRAQRQVRSRRDLRRRKPTTTCRRTANGVSLPKDVAVIEKKKRKELARMQVLRKRAAALKAQLARVTSNTNPDRVASLNAEIVRLKSREDKATAEAKHLRRDAKRRMAVLTREHYAKEGARLAKMLRKNPHRFFRVMKQALPETHEVHDESSGPSAAKALQSQSSFYGSSRGCRMTSSLMALRSPDSAPLSLTPMLSGRGRWC